MRVCIGLPTRNEVQNIEAMVKRIRKACPGKDVIIFDEHSDDGTLDIAKNLKVPVVQRKYSGYGAGILSAIEYTYNHNYDVLAVLDCDQTYPPEDLPKLLEHMGSYDFVTGARDLRCIHPKLHRLPNMFHTGLANFLFGSRLRDINSGMWALRPSRFVGKLKSFDMTFTVELYTRAVKNSYRIKHVTVGYDKRVGDSKIRVKDGFNIAWRIISERLKP